MISKKMLAIAAAAAVGVVTVANASGLEHIFEPQNYKWFENRSQAEDYDYVAGDGQEADLADQDQKSEEHTGDSQQAVQLGQLQFMDTTVSDTQDNSDVLGRADTSAPVTDDSITGNGVVFVNNDNPTDATTTIISGNHISDNGIGAAENTNNSTKEDQNGSSASDANDSDSDHGHKSDNSDNNGNNNGSNNGNNSGDNNSGEDNSDDPGNDEPEEPASWEEVQLRPRDPVETEYGVLTGLSAKITKEAYYFGESFSGEDAVVTGTFQKNGKTEQRVLSYGGTDGYDVQFSTSEKGNLTAVFRYPANSDTYLTARAAYYVMQSTVLGGYQALLDNNEDYYYRKDFPGVSLKTSKVMTEDMYNALLKLISPPASNPNETQTVDMLELHRAMIALLGNNTVQYTFLQSDNYKTTTFLEEDAQGYLTNMLIGFSWVADGTRMDGDHTYVYYPGGNWGTTQRNAVNIITAVPEGYKIRRVAELKQTDDNVADWSSYRGDQVLEQYTGTDSTLEIPMGVTAIDLKQKAESVTTLVLPNSVQSIDAESIAENLPNLTAYTYASEDEIQNSVGAYKIIDGILYSADGKTLISVPPAKKNVVIADTVTTLGKNCLKGVTANVQFKGSTTPKITETTGYEGTIIVPESKYDLVCKNMMFAFGRECDQIKFKDTTGKQMSYRYDENGPQLVSYKKTATGTETVLEALPKYLSGKYSVDGGIDKIGTGAFVNCVKLTDLEIGSNVQELGTGSLILPEGISDIRLTGSDVKISKYVFGNPKNGATVPDVTISVNEADYDSYLESWSAILDPVYGKGTAKKLLAKDTGSIFYENGVKYQEVTENDQTYYILVKVYDDSLSALQVKDGTREIKKGAFDGCERLEILYLPESVSRIANNVFDDASKLENIVTEGSAECVQKAGTTSAEILAPGEAFTGFSYEDGIVYGENTSGGWTLLNVPTDYSQVIYIKEGTTVLYREALKGCTKLADLWLLDPESLVEIGDSCFADTVLPSGMNLQACTSLVRIGEYAFKNCTGMTVLYLPASVNTLEKGVFYNCSSLQEVRTNGLEVIKDQAFFNCTQLKTVSNLAQRAVGNDLSRLKSLGKQAFYGCRNILTLSLGTELTELGEECFGNCVSLRSVEMNGKVSGISRYCFYGCIRLEEITFSEQQQQALTLIGVEAFGGCEQLKKIDLRDLKQLTQMGEGTFTGCSNLVSVKFPESLKKVPDYCFTDCDKLSVLQLNATEVTTFGTNVFGDTVPKNLSITVPEDVLENYRSEVEKTLDAQYKSDIAEQMVDKITDSEIIDGILYEIVPEGKILKKGYSYIEGSREIEPDTIEIADDAFRDCTGLTEIIVPAAATVKIGNRCFIGCTGLKSVQILGNIPEWGDETFMDCTSIEQITLGSYVADGALITYKEIAKIGDRAFKNCTGLKGTATTAPVTIRGHVAELGEECFAGCSNWVSIAMTDSCRAAMKKIDAYAFAGCKQFKALLTAKFTGLESIGEYAFWDCDSMTMPSIPVNVKSIGEGCFMDCDNLKYVSFYGSVAEYPKNCFKNCPKLLKTGGTAAAFKGLETIGESAYEGCTSLLSTNNLNWGLEKYENLKTIGVNAFKDCTAMPYANIPATVTSIGDGAFDGCGNMALIQFNSATPPEIGTMSNVAFPENLAITVPDSQADGDSVYLAYARVLQNAWGTDLVNNALDSETDGAKDRVSVISEVTEVSEPDSEPGDSGEQEQIAEDDSTDATENSESETEEGKEIAKDDHTTVGTGN